MKLKPSLRNLAKAGLLLKQTILLLLLCAGCTSSTAPSFSIKDIPGAIQDICKEEYKIDLVTRLVGQTLWIYIPVEDIFIPSDKPEKYTDKFEIEENSSKIVSGVVKVDYKIKAIPEQEKIQEFKYNKSVQEKISNVWKVLRRVIFSLERSKGQEPKLYYIVTADIKNGIEMSELIYYQDLLKVSYELISWGEYSHRAISQTNISDEVIGDEEGKHLKFRDIPIEEFITEQIAQRIKLKFQKPEVDKNADIDKEILKLVINTIKIYGFKDFNGVDLYNFITEDRTILNKAAVEASLIE